MTKLYYTERELPQKSDKWHKVRESCIGGSDIPTVLGANSKYDSPYQLWERKTNRAPRKEMNAAMLRGIEMEPQAHGHIKLELSKRGIKNPKITPYFAKHPDFPYIGISFDGVDTRNKFITEIKSPMNIWNFKTVFTNGIQDYYYPQVQAQLFVANAIWGISKAYFCSFYPDGAYILDDFEFKEYLRTLAVVDIEFNKEYCERMNNVVRQFWKFVNEDYWNQEEYDEVIREFNNERI